MDNDFKQAFLLMTTSDSESIVSRVRNLSHFAPCCVAHEAACGLSFPADLVTWEFTLDEMPFSTLGERVVPGSTIFAAMVFLLESDYDGIWFVEDDAFLKGGNWQRLLDIGRLGYDFIGVEVVEPEPDWIWTKCFRLPDGMNTGDMWFLKSLCGVCHLSRAAAFVVTSMLRLGFAGHHEMVVPTLVHHCGLKMADLTTLGMVDNQYFRAHPAITIEEIATVAKGMLVHPCKDLLDGERLGDGMIALSGDSPGKVIDEVSTDDIAGIFALLGGLPFGCSHAEYHFLGWLVRGGAPAKLLVFGVGRDTAAWIRVNSHGGTCLFLENDSRWIRQVQKDSPQSEIRKISYTLGYDDWVAKGCPINECLLPTIEEFDFDQPWDFAFVDGPIGGTIGRQQSAYLATRVLRYGGLLAIHDCERDREKVICLKVIEAAGFLLLGQVERLRIYKKGVREL